jgi:hypothetical protein
MFGVCSIQGGPETLLQQRPALTTTRKDRAMASSQLPPLDYLRQCFKYNPETGDLFWRERPEDHFPTTAQQARCNAIHANKRAFTAIHRTGRYVGGLCGKQLLAHRVAYYLGTGEHPDDLVDHINGDPLDNRLVNLRLATRSENARNRGRTEQLWDAPYFGVRKGSVNRWRAQIYANGKMVELGSFLTLEEAIAARKAAEEHYGFHENHGRKKPPILAVK